MNRRTLLAGAASFGAASVLAACASTAPVTPASVASDVTLIANGLAGALANVSVPGVTIPPAVATALADLQAVAKAIGSADTIAAAQPLVLRVEADVNAVVAATAALPTAVQPYLAAAMVLLPIVETAVNLLVPASASPSSMTPDQARAVLRVAAGH